MKRFFTPYDVFPVERKNKTGFSKLLTRFGGIVKQLKIQFVLFSLKHHCEQRSCVIL